MLWNRGGNVLIYVQWPLPFYPTSGNQDDELLPLVNIVQEMSWFCDDASHFITFSGHVCGYVHK